MNKTTYEKIKDNSALLHKIYGIGKYENYELFDEPYKLAIASAGIAVDLPPNSRIDGRSIASRPE